MSSRLSVRSANDRDRMIGRDAFARPSHLVPYLHLLNSVSARGGSFRTTELLVGFSPKWLRLLALSRRAKFNMLHNLAL